MLDKVSGPAAKITKAVRGVGDELTKVRKSSGLDKLASGLKAAREPANALGKALAKVAATAAGMAVAGAGMLAVGGKYVLDSVAFKRNALASLEAVEGSKSAASEAFASIRAFVD